MKLSEYCISVKDYIEDSVKSIEDNGNVSAYNGKVYNDSIDFIDDCVISIVEYIVEGVLEKDVDIGEGMRLSGIINVYLTHTGIVGKVVKERSPLGFLKK